MPKVGRAESLIAGLNRGGAQPGGLRRPTASASEPDDEQERQQRRAAAAGDSVSLAAAGMSEGVPDEIAIPATTLLGVEEADEVTSGHEGTAEDTRQDEAATTVDPAGRHDAAPAGPEGTPAGEAVETESDSADDDPAGRYDAGPAGSDSTPAVEDADGEEIHVEPTDHWTDGAEPVEEPPADHWTDGEEPADDDGRGQDEAADGGVPEDDEQTPARPVQRPLGQAPLLDSEPLPATRPGMLRPRTGDEGPFSLPAQRPAFDLGSGTPADNIA